jgi:hypothetical protein
MRNTEYQFLFFFFPCFFFIFFLFLLIEKGANVNARDDAGMLPIHFAARRGHMGLIYALARMGANFEAQTNNGMWPIDFVAQGADLTISGQIAAEIGRGTTAWEIQNACEMAMKYFMDRGLRADSILPYENAFGNEIVLRNILYFTYFHMISIYRHLSFILLLPFSIVCDCK